MIAFYLTVRVLHVLTGVFWAGSVFFIVLYVFPAVIEAGPAGGQFMGVIQRRGWSKAVMHVALVTVITGIYLLWRISGHFSPDFMGSKPGILFSVGMLAGLTAVFIGLFGTMPTGKRMDAIGAAMAERGGPPSPEDMAELGRLRDRLGKLVRIIAVLLLIALVTMALGPHV